MSPFICPNCGHQALKEMREANEFLCQECFHLFRIVDVFKAEFGNDASPLFVAHKSALDEVDQLIEQLGGAGKAVSHD